MVDLAEQFPNTSTPDVYLHRLSGMQNLDGYADLPDESKQYTTYLALDTELIASDFDNLVRNEIANASTGSSAIGAAAVSHVVHEEQSNNREADNHSNLPRTFEEASYLPNNTIEDFVKGIDLDATNALHDAIKRDRLAPLTVADADFLALADNIKRYEADLLAFSNELSRDNVYQSQRRVQSRQDEWLQLDSKEFIRSRVEQETVDTPVARIYLNPALASTLSVYKEVFTRAEASGVRFKSKVLDFELRSIGEDRKGQYFDYLSRKSTKRTDPIVFYAFEESKDDLLQIVNDVYAEHPDAFSGQAVGNVPAEIAPGYALGAEPVGLSGVESLTAHRFEVVGSLIKRLSALSEWRTLTGKQKQNITALNFRRHIAHKQRINPDNIAFNT